MSAELGTVHANMMAAIDEIDVQLDSLSGGKTSGKRKITKDLTEKYNELFSSALSSTVEFIKELDSEQKVAVVSAFKSGLSQFDKEVNAYVDGIIESQPTQAPLIDDEQAKVLQAQRSELYGQVKAIVGLAESIGEGPYEMPKMRRGSSGKRGPRNLSLFTFWIDGEEVDMTIGQIAKENGYDKAGDLTKALRTKVEGGWEGFDTQGGDSFDDFKLPNGKVLSGQRDDSEEEEEEESTED